MKQTVFLFIGLLLGLDGCAAHALKKADNDSIKLSLHMPRAASVRFLSSLDGFLAHETRRTAMGFWEIQLPAAKPFHYFYQVDGSFYLPDCPLKEYDDLGTRNCIYLP
jgi:hypothetical protein